MNLNPDMLAWFNKPEEAMNKQLNKTMHNINITHQEMLEKLEKMQEVCNKYIDQIGI